MIRRFVLVPVLLLISAHFLIGQVKPDSSRTDRRVTREKPAVFADEDGDGIDDRTGSNRQGRKRGKDRFVDRDGDGICDGRASGLGFRSGGEGGQGKGRRRGQGGQQ